MAEFRLLASNKPFVGFLMGPIILCLFYLSSYYDNFHQGTGITAFGQQQQDQKKELAEKYTFERSWGSKGTGDGQFKIPHSLAIDLFGNVYVPQILVTIGSRNFLPMVRSLKNGDQKVAGQFNQLHDIAVDPIGNFVYTVELANHRVQKFDNNGTFLTKWDFNYTGGAGADRRPHQLAVDSYGYVYLTDRGGSEVLKFNNNGTFMEKWGAYGSGAKQFVRPHGIAFDSKDYMYVTDMGN